MINPQRGEVAITVDGSLRTMRLTLGALAALEDALGTTSLVELVERFETGAFRSADLLLLVWAGVNGGGWSVDRDALGQMEIEGGPIAAAKAGARLLHLTFGGSGS